MKEIESISHVIDFKIVRHSLSNESLAANLYDVPWLTTSKAKLGNDNGETFRTREELRARELLLFKDKGPAGVISLWTRGRPGRLARPNIQSTC